MVTRVSYFIENEYKKKVDTAINDDDDDEKLIYLIRWKHTELAEFVKLGFFFS